MVLLGGLHPDLRAGLEAPDIGPAPMDNRQNLDTLRADTVNQAVGSFENFAEGRISSFGHVAAGERELAELRPAAQDPLDHPRRVHGRRLADIIPDRGELCEGRLGQTTGVTGWADAGA